MKQVICSNQGFAISAVIYSILLLFVILLAALLTMLANRKIILEKTKRDLLEDVNQETVEEDKRAYRVILNKKQNSDENLFMDDFGVIRYRGINVKNYVLFNGEKWRIIGVFDESVKLVKADLNESSISCTYNKGIDCFTKPYNSRYPTIYDALNMASGMISSTYYNMVEEHTYYLSSVASVIPGKESLYKEEMNDLNHRANLSNKLGVPYLSDYLYAVGEDCHNGAYRYGYCTEDNWMDTDMMNKWVLMTMNQNNLNEVVTVYPKGGVKMETLDSGEARIRLTLYLKSDVKIVGGEGTETSPYQLSL